MSKGSRAVSSSETAILNAVSVRSARDRRRSSLPLRHATLLLCTVVAMGCGGNVVTPTSGDAGVDAAATPDAVIPVDLGVTLVDAVVAPDRPVAPDVVALPDVVPVPDVPPPVDVITNPTGLPDGEPCAADSECRSGACAHGEGLVSACAPACRRDADCASLGVSYRCAVDRAPARTRLVCAEPERGGADWLQPCRANSDCRSALCVDGTCRGACATDADCAGGLTCGTVTVNGAALSLCRVAPITGVTVERFVLREEAFGVDTGTSELRALIPADAVSATWTTQDVEGRELFAAVARLVSPANNVVVDLRSWNLVREQPLRTIPARYGYNAAMVSANDTLTLTPGVWRSQHLLFNDRSSGTAVAERRLRAGLIIKRAPGGLAANGWTLRVQLILTGLRDVTRASAPTNPRLQAAVATMQRLYRAVGVNVVVNGYDEFNPASAARFSVIDSRAELQELLAQASYRESILPIYLVRGISTSAGLEGAIGVAGGIPGPPGTFSTGQSGVVVGWETTLGRTDVLPLTMAHETGHYLGLFHTRERLAPCATVTQTDCSGWGGADAITDTPNDDAAAARYLMYWQAVGGNELLSPGQGLVLRRSALVY